MGKYKKKGGDKKLKKNIREISINAVGTLRELGPIIDMTYQWADGDHYKHKFRKTSRPLLIYDEKGQLFIIDGKYTVDDEKGIIDY